jgi:hypothetical protein
MEKIPLQLQAGLVLLLLIAFLGRGFGAPAARPITLLKVQVEGSA